MPRQKSKLPTSTVLAGTEFQPTDKLWTSLADAYGTTFSTEQIAALREVIESYFIWVEFELAAEPAEKTLALLRKIESAAAALSRVMNERGNSESANYAERLIEQYLEVYGRAAKTLNACAKMTDDLIVAAKKARSEFNSKNYDSHKPGEAWGNLINGLTKWAEANGLATGVRKDDMAEPSPFVKFVFRLQTSDCFPDKFCRHTHSNAALAKAISDARKCQRD